MKPLQEVPNLTWRTPSQSELSRTRFCHPNACRSTCRCVWADDHPPSPLRSDRTAKTQT